VLVETGVFWVDEDVLAVWQARARNKESQGAFGACPFISEPLGDGLVLEIQVWVGIKRRLNVAGFKVICENAVPVEVRVYGPISEGFHGGECEVLTGVGDRVVMRPAAKSVGARFERRVLGQLEGVYEPVGFQT